MEMKSLLLAQEQETITLLLSVLRELQLGVEVCSSREDVLDRLLQEKYHAVIVDSAVTGSNDLLRFCRVTGENRNCVSLAVVDTLAEMQAALDLGADFVLCKPLSADAVARSVRAMKGLIFRMGRRSVRVVVPSLVYASIDGQEDQAIVLDVSEGGLAVQALEPIEASRSLTVGLRLPGTGQAIEATAEIAWADASGRAGIRFLDMSSDCCQLLKEWVRVNMTPPAQIALTQQRSARLCDDDRERQAQIKLAVLGQHSHGQPTALLWQGRQSIARRLFATLVDSAIVFAASVLFAALVFGVVGALLSPRWGLLLGLLVPCLFWTAYQALFLTRMVGTPGMRLARLSAGGENRNGRLARAASWPLTLLQRLVAPAPATPEPVEPAVAGAAPALGAITISPVR
jgi:CheY-like chemotaxis protein